MRYKDEATSIFSKLLILLNQAIMQKTTFMILLNFIMTKDLINRYLEYIKND